MKKGGVFWIPQCHSVPTAFIKLHRVCGRRASSSTSWGSCGILLSWVTESAAIMSIALANGGGKPPDWQDFVGIITLLVIKHLLRLPCFHLKGACGRRPCRFVSVSPYLSSSPLSPMATNIKGMQTSMSVYNGSTDYLQLAHYVGFPLSAMTAVRRWLSPLPCFLG